MLLQWLGFLSSEPTVTWEQELAECQCSRNQHCLQKRELRQLLRNGRANVTHMNIRLTAKERLRTTLQSLKCCGSGSFPTRPAKMTPVYSALLVVVGTIFGRHAYFRVFAVRMLSRFGVPPELMDKSFHETSKNFRKW